MNYHTRVERKRTVPTFTNISASIASEYYATNNLQKTVTN